MKRPARALLQLLVLLVASGGGAASAQEPPDHPSLRWLVQDMAPHFSYPNGRAPQRPEELGHGEIDGFLRLLIARLPQYPHVFVEAGLPRFEALARQPQAPICSLLHVRTPERLGWLYFTPLYPPLVSRQLHVIVRRDQLQRFEQQGQSLQLAELLQRRDLRALLPRDRSFGPRIDALLLAQGARAPQTVVAGRNGHLLAMLRARRMDYTLEYASTVDEFLRGGEAGAELVKLPIAEGRSTAVAVAACSRSPAGRRQIEAIDEAVRALAQDPQREAWIKAWRGDALDEQDRQRIQRFMDERARGGAQIE